MVIAAMGRKNNKNYRTPQKQKDRWRNKKKDAYKKRARKLQQDLWIPTAYTEAILMELMPELFSHTGDKTVE